MVESVTDDEIRMALVFAHNDKLRNEIDHLQAELEQEKARTAAAETTSILVLGTLADDWPRLQRLCRLLHRARDGGGMLTRQLALLVLGEKK